MSGELSNVGKALLYAAIGAGIAALEAIGTIIVRWNLDPLSKPSNWVAYLVSAAVSAAILAALPLLKAVLPGQPGPTTVLPPYPYAKPTGGYSPSEVIGGTSPPTPTVTTSSKPTQGPGV